MGNNLDILKQIEPSAKAEIEPFPISGLKSFEHLLRSTGDKKGLILGTGSALSLAIWLSNETLRYSKAQPHLILLPQDEDVAKTKAMFQFFSPKIQIHELKSFDISPYSNLYPNKVAIAQRLRWLWAAQHARPGDVFVASLPGLLQKTLPFEVLAEESLNILKGSELAPNIAQILNGLGYGATPLVEDVGTYSLRGGIFDFYSPAHHYPIRIELFGDTIESMRFFDPETQRSLQEISSASIIPAAEVMWSDEVREHALELFKQSLSGRDVDDEEAQSMVRSLAQGQYFHGIEFLLPYFYEKPGRPLDHFSTELFLWKLDPIEISRSRDNLISELKKDYASAENHTIRPYYFDFYSDEAELNLPEGSKQIEISRLLIQENDENLPEEDLRIGFSTSELSDLVAKAKSLGQRGQDLALLLQEKIREWKKANFRVFLCTSTTTQAQRLRLLLEPGSIRAELLPLGARAWGEWIREQDHNPDLVHILPEPLGESIRLQTEHVIFVNEEDLFGRRRAKKEAAPQSQIDKRARVLSFGDLKPGDFVVHKTHGIGLYEGLKVMPIQGVDAEFIQLSYKDKDKLYLPVYRVGQIQKYSGPGSQVQVDKLGGTGWEKTTSKVKKHLRDMAQSLLDLYSRRSQVQRPPFSMPEGDYLSFENSFQFDETEDQLRAISEVLGDMNSDKPMDRLICGDVGFGKTEIAMRAAFKAVQDRRQVAIIAPTTVLTFQHVENFMKRFKGWPINIRSLNRFVPKSEIRKTLEETKSGSVDILIGTHRLLSKDVQFKDLGLMIVDEEQKFGVKHKERLRQIKLSVDTLALSATPIPRTLNMSLMGLRDLSLINTAPVDRLPTRTFVCKFDPETIRKSVTSEVARGGQVFFIHNRIQSIYELAGRLREILPGLRMSIAHGQLPEDELEKVMVSFFNHEIDVLICTAIVESGMDVPRANTMFIDNAHTFGLSQLYQLRGRVGRSKDRAYCYLLVPGEKKIDKLAQERLKVIQENTALGSGFKIAHYDLELRGSGDLLGEEQSGHIGAVGYELYLELLDAAVKEAKGEPSAELDVEPDINIRIPAFIPDNYISDIRIRLAYYKALADIQGPEDIDQIESDLRDQFGKIPEPVLNLFGIMSIRKLCKDLGVRDLSAGAKSVSLAFTPATPLSPEKAVELASRPNKKYSVTPDSRLNVRMNEITWPRVYEELQYLIAQS